MPVQNGSITITLKANSGEIWRPADKYGDGAPKADTTVEVWKVEEAEPVASEPVKEEVKTQIEVPVKETTKPEEKKVEIPVNKSYEEMTIEELQQVILGKMAKNGPVTDQMKKTVYDNTHHGSLITWARSFQ